MNPPEAIASTSDGNSPGTAASPVSYFARSKLLIQPAVRVAGSRMLSLPVFRTLRMVRLRRLEPVGRGRMTGTPIVRQYWHSFLSSHQADIRGSALEIGTTETIRRYGSENVTTADGLDIAKHSPDITLVGDLSRGDLLPADAYDCFVNQFTMHVIDDVEAALFHSIRMLKPGGVLLVNFPCLDSEFPHGLDMGTGRPMFVFHWFTSVQVCNLFARAGLAPRDYTISTFGNLFARIAYQMNLPAEELTREELDRSDPAHPLLICARVVKPEKWTADKPVYRESWLPAGTPATWSTERGHYQPALEAGRFR